MSFLNSSFPQEIAAAVIMQKGASENVGWLVKWAKLIFLQLVFKLKIKRK